MARAAAAARLGRPESSRPSFTSPAHRVRDCAKEPEQTAAVTGTATPGQEIASSVLTGTDHGVANQPADRYNSITTEKADLMLPSSAGGTGREVTGGNDRKAGNAHDVPALQEPERGGADRRRLGSLSQLPLLRMVRVRRRRARIRRAASRCYRPQEGGAATRGGISGPDLVVVTRQRRDGHQPHAGQKSERGKL